MEISFQSCADDIMLGPLDIFNALVTKTRQGRCILAVHYDVYLASVSGNYSRSHSAIPLKRCRSITLACHFLVANCVHCNTHGYLSLVYRP